MSLLHPRLARELARPIIQQLGEADAGDLSDRVEMTISGHTFAPIGGREVTVPEIEDLRAKMLEVAWELGFPGRPTLEQRVRFDGRAGRLLYERMGITPHQAADEDLWTHLTLGPLLDIAGWRFPNLSEDHLLGRGPRSTFRRLWWRAELLGGYSWDENHPLREDETVQIMERPELVGNPSLARALARGFLRRVEADPELNRMDLMRDGLKRAYRLSPFMRWEALSPEGLGSLIDRLFADAAAALLEPATPGTLLPDESGPDDPSHTYLAPPIEAPGATETEDDAPATPEETPAFSASTFDEVPLANLGPMIRAAVAAHDEVDEDALVTAFEELHGIEVARPRRRLFSKLAWSARGRGLLDHDETTGVWSTGPRDEPQRQFGNWTFGALIELADELLTGDPEPFEQMLDRVNGDGRAPRALASVTGTAINVAKRNRRGRSA